MSKFESLIKRFDSIFNNAKEEIDRIYNEVTDLISKGRDREALRVWRSKVRELVNDLQSSISVIKNEFQDAEFSDSDIARFREYIELKMRDFIEKYEQGMRELEKILDKKIDISPDHERTIFLFKLPSDLSSTINDMLRFVEKSIGDIASNFTKLVEGFLYEISNVVSSVRIRVDDLRIIDQLVSAGIFRSRSEAISYFTRKGIEASRDWIDKALEQAKRIRELQESIKRELEKI